MAIRNEMIFLLNGIFKKQTVMCSPENEQKIRDAISLGDLSKYVKIVVSDYVPEGQVFIFNEPKE